MHDASSAGRRSERCRWETTRVMTTSNPVAPTSHPTPGHASEGTGAPLRQLSPRDSRPVRAVMKARSSYNV